MTNGIVVDHKETGIRYAVSYENFNEEEHTKVRDLEVGESAQAFTPISRTDLAGDPPKAVEAAPEDPTLFEIIKPKGQK